MCVLWEEGTTPLAQVAPEPEEWHLLSRINMNPVHSYHGLYNLFLPALLLFLNPCSGEEATFCSSNQID
jgi:hypothetical protein